MDRHLVDLPPVADVNTRTIPKLDESTADYIHTDLTSMPISILESHDLSNMTMEYKRECGRDNVLKSLTHVLNGGEGGGFVDFDCIECEHSLQLMDGANIVKARTKWMLKFADSFRNLGQ
ncbi:Thiolester hydrolase [Sarracenia purpurea var. burkii]